uniref:UDP-N-acetylmuramoyl-L-alanyl-D-glutamate--2,6-diaminopimelate ligase n=1 Tax=Eiseniibacteriota bacterium TaxID=2212470 RepID=A0A832I025_UNCEI
MTLRELVAESAVTAAHGDLRVEIGGLAYDSRRVRPGDAFFALAGLHADGARFVDDAFARGAAAAVVAAGTATARAPRVEVEEPRRALAECANRWHGHPSRELDVVGVTGTNGKTTVTWLLEAVFRAAGRTTGIVGTTGVRIGDEQRPSAFTTPEAPELQGVLRAMAARGVRAVAIEVSSHALAQRRAYGTECAAVVFTNLSQDHLDYHGTMEAYLDAKLMLFDGRNLPAGARRPHAVVNADDAAAPRVLAAARGAGLEVTTYGAAPADVTIADLAPRPDGLAFTLVAGGAATPVALPFLGRYNAWNAAAAFAAARALGVSAAAAARGLAGAPGVPGRLERVDAGQPFTVVVDYAHTPDALARALAALREHAGGRVLLVFGCGGDRDRGKRPLMGRIAAEAADRAWVTSDNPRSEDPAAIAADVRAGDPHGRLAVELDRRAAIARALGEARPGDVVLVAGKGHETTQTIGGRVLPFDDREVARELLAGGRP